MIQNEINIHKYKLKQLIDNLLNTQNINEEIMFNNEIKKESEFLISLLNIKSDSSINQMNQINPINNIMNLNFNPNNIGINMMPINQPNFNFNNNNTYKQKMIDIIFSRDWDEKKIVVQCYPWDKISDVILKYKNKINDFNHRHYIFSGKDLKYASSKTVLEIGFRDKDKITVSQINNLPAGSQLKNEAKSI